MTGYADLSSWARAFMLLETKNIVQFALLFGTTWLVNALVMAGVLVAVLAAVEVSRHVVARRPALLYAALLAALVLAWAVPPESLLTLSPLPRFAVAVVIAFAPIFVANMVFAQRFRTTGDSGTAFGANLLGAILGGVLEYLSADRRGTGGCSSSWRCCTGSRSSPAAVTCAPSAVRRQADLRWPRPRGRG